MQYEVKNTKLVAWVNEVAGDGDRAAAGVAGLIGGE